MFRYDTPKQWDMVMQHQCIERESRRIQTEKQFGDAAARVAGLASPYRQGQSITTGLTCQMCRQYSPIARSEENFPILATFRTLLLSHSSRRR